MNLFSDIDLNIEELEKRFMDCQDVIGRKFPVGRDQSVKVYATYIDMITNKELLEEQVISRLMIDMRITSEVARVGDIVTSLVNEAFATAEVEEIFTFEEVADAMLSGDGVIIIDGADKAIVVSMKGSPNRGVPTAEIEAVVQGSKEAFNEVYRVNTTLIRRRIKDTNLKLLQTRVGRRSKTDVGIMYIEGIVRPKILEEVKSRIDSIDIDAILDASYIEEFIEDNSGSPFPQLQLTERPDKTASALLEGRIAIVVDNSPFVLIVPATFNTFFQASDDYYSRWHISSLIRILRFICGFIAIAGPGLYLATAVFHPSMIPMLLTLKMAESRQLVPFPAAVEILLMEFAFELLREAGIRLPGPVGSAIGIVGGLIVGSAAVDAGIVSPIVVIIAALTGIASFTIPEYSLTAGFRVMKYFVTLSSAVLGLFGFWASLIAILIHLASLKSFGIPYLFPFVSGDINNYGDYKDSFFRAPLSKMKKRPIFAQPGAEIRLKTKKLEKEKNKE